MDYTAVATALATAYSTLPTPAGGYRALRLATFQPPEAVPPLPCVMVFPPASGDYESGNGTRKGVHDWKVRFLYDQAGDLARQTAGLLKWAEKFDAQLRTSAQLGGIVVSAILTGYEIGFFGYAGKMYAGIEGTVRVVTSESWAAVS
jgi:hypothetical protein